MVVGAGNTRRKQKSKERPLPLNAMPNHFFFPPLFLLAPSAFPPCNPYPSPLAFLCLKFFSSLFFLLAMDSLQNFFLFPS
ncbi:hypothetical protein QBC36DRAFT_48773 [Triangularia setosa]|uniref:Transmembrane protein n=1 Tax=Triangularia setosa TaxID=2587417 RepID=A0AAN7A5G0_9PEZI|nr:hypothetical protein QBC36DRAFT_48773 [Podospora setosa]